MRPRDPNPVNPEFDPQLADDLAQIVSDSKNIVFLGGAGVSTESGVPDFRSATTVERAQRDFGHGPEVLLSTEFYFAHTDVFYRYLRDVLMVEGIQPNPAHRALASWEKMGILSGIATQNIDGLHQLAGSNQVWELHGTLATFHCPNCPAITTQTEVIKQIDSGTAVPKCSCGAALKPDVVLYGEMLPEQAFIGAVNAISGADTLIVGGTSLAVYPAASLINSFSGQNLVVVNLEETKADMMASFVAHAPIGALLEQVDQILTIG